MFDKKRIKSNIKGNKKGGIGSS